MPNDRWSFLAEQCKQQCCQLVRLSKWKYKITCFVHVLGGVDVTRHFSVRLLLLLSTRQRGTFFPMASVGQLNIKVRLRSIISWTNYTSMSLYLAWHDVSFSMHPGKERHHSHSEVFELGDFWTNPFRKWPETTNHIVTKETDFPYVCLVLHVMDIAKVLPREHICSVQYASMAARGHQQTRFV